MPSIKIYPPSQLPDRNVNETEFNIWREELEVYLSQEADFQHFLPDGRYLEWQSQEVLPNRLAALKGADLTRHADQVAIISNDALLHKRRRDLRTFLSIIGKCVSQGHYTSVIRHSHSFTEICNSLRSDYDIQKKGIHFFNLLDLAYDPDKMTPMSFYNQYRTVICNNLGKTGDTIKYKDNAQLQTDEKMTPMLEDIVLLNAVEIIDKRLPAFLKTHYNHKMKQDDRLMDFKSDIMVNIPQFLETLDSSDQGSSTLNAFRPNWRKKTQPNNGRANNQQFSNNKNLYCRLCWKFDMPRAIFTNHNLGDSKCPQLSHKDKMQFNASKMSAFAESEDDVEENPSVLRGYTDEFKKADKHQVVKKEENCTNNAADHFSEA